MLEADFSGGRPLSSSPRRRLVLAAALLLVPCVAPAEEPAHEPAPAQAGHALSPMFGYDPVPGLLLGAAYFFYPRAAEGWRGSVQAILSTRQLRTAGDAEVVGQRLWGDLSPRAAVAFSAFKGRYYGAGMGTEAGRWVTSDPLRADASLGVLYAISGATTLGLHARGGTVRDARAGDLEAFARFAEGKVNGAFLGGRLELAHDTRDNPYSTTSGGREVLWAEGYGLQAGAASRRALAGLSVSRFVALRAPWLVLALRAEAGASAGDRAYATDFSLGGADLLRGYFGGRFRGEHEVAGSAELRFPIWRAVSGAAFADAGRVWARAAPGGRDVAVSGGGGIRIGLPPDRLVKLRFDVAFAPDQWGLFFKFNEAF